MASKGYNLRSGGAGGCDTFFEEIYQMEHGHREIFLPWKGFNDRYDGIYDDRPVRIDVLMSIAKRYHPKWNNLRRPAKLMMCRNVLQVMGRYLDNPSEFVVCWTKDGRECNTTKDTGGTGQAIRIANDLDIPVYNIRNEMSLQLLWERIQE